MLPRLLRLFCMVFLLVFSQQGALLHELSHLSDTQRQTSGTPLHQGSDFCDQCAALSAAHGLATPGQLLLPKVPTGAVFAGVTRYRCIVFYPLAPAARGPPLLA